MSSLPTKGPSPGQQFDVPDSIIHTPGLLTKTHRIPNPPNTPNRSEPNYIQFTFLHSTINKESVPIHKIRKTLFLKKIPFTHPTSDILPNISHHQTTKKKNGFYPPYLYRKKNIISYYKRNTYLFQPINSSREAYRERVSNQKP